MSEDVAIYAQNASTISVDDLRAHMRARGLPVEWQYTLHSERDQPTNWTMGNIFPEGKQTPLISIFTEAVTPDIREEMLSAYADSMAESHRQALSTAKIKYQLDASGAPQGERQRLLVNLVDLLAERGDGLIHDIGSEQFYNRDEYRAQHFDLLNT
jgi:hypothetical protein